MVHDSVYSVQANLLADSNCMDSCTLGVCCSRAFERALVLVSCDGFTFLFLGAKQGHEKQLLSVCLKVLVYTCDRLFIPVVFPRTRCQNRVSALLHELPDLLTGSKLPASLQYA